MMSDEENSDEPIEEVTEDAPATSDSTETDSKGTSETDETTDTPELPPKKMQTGRP